MQMKKAIFLNTAIPVSCRVSLFQSLILSRLLYGCAIWTEISQASFKKLESMVIDSYRMILGVGYWSDERMSDTDFLQGHELMPFRIHLARHRLCYLQNVAKHGITAHKTLLLEEMTTGKGWLHEVALDLKWMNEFQVLPFDHPASKHGKFCVVAHDGRIGSKNPFRSTLLRKRLLMISGPTITTFWQSWSTLECSLHRTKSRHHHRQELFVVGIVQHSFQVNSNLHYMRSDSTESEHKNANMFNLMFALVVSKHSIHPSESASTCGIDPINAGSAYLEFANQIRRQTLCCQRICVVSTDSPLSGGIMDHSDQQLTTESDTEFGKPSHS